MNFLAKSRVLAAAVLVVAAVAGCALGTVRSVRSQEKKVEKAFVSSSESYAAVRPALADVSRAAHSFLSVYETICGGSDDDSRAFADALERFDARMTSPFQLTVTPEDLRRQAALMYATVQERDTEKKDAKYYYTSLKSSAQTLSHNEEYNAAAEAFNEKTGSFPARLVRRGEAVVFS